MMLLQYVIVVLSGLLALPVASSDCKALYEFAENTACGTNCVYRLFYRTAYSGATIGMEETLDSLEAFDYCTSPDNVGWCPDTLNDTTSAIASEVVKSLAVDFSNCDGECLLFSMIKITRQATLSATQWADNVFYEVNDDIHESHVQDLHETMFELSEDPATDFDLCKLAENVHTEDTPHHHSTHHDHSKKLEIDLPFLAAPGALFGTFLTEKTCNTDPILCSGATFEYLRRIIDSAKHLLHHDNQFRHLLEHEATEKVPFEIGPDEVPPVTDTAFGEWASPPGHNNG